MNPVKPSRAQQRDRAIQLLALTKVDTTDLAKHETKQLDCKKPEFAHLSSERWRRHQIVTMTSKVRS